MTVYWKPARRRWMYDFQFNGQRKNGYCLDRHGQPVKTKRQAQDAEADLRSTLRNANANQPPKPGSYSLAQAIQAFALTLGQGRHDQQNQPVYMAEIGRRFGLTTPLANIGVNEINAWIEWGLQQPIMIWKGGNIRSRKRIDPRWWMPHPEGRLRSPSTMNRYLACLSGIMSLAHNTRDPFTGHALLPFPPKVPELDEPEKLARPIRNEPMAAILEHAAPHVVEAAAITNHFPLRKTEAAFLRISHVDRFERGLRIPAAETKANREEFFPASEAAWAFLEFLVAQARRRGTDYLITWQPKGKTAWVPIRNNRKAWKAAQKRAGIEQPFRFHDNKAAFSSNLSALGMERRGVQDASRHRDPSTTDRYIAAVDDWRRPWMERLADYSVTTEFMKRLAAGEQTGIQSPEQQSRTRKNRARGKSPK
jgi:integrase